MVLGRKGKQTTKQADVKSQAPKRHDEPELFKFQRAQYTTGNPRLMLVYNQTKSKMGEVEADDGFWALFDKLGEKFYATAKYDNVTGKVKIEPNTQILGSADIAKWPQW